MNCKTSEEKKILVNNIILSGGNSMFNGLPERFKIELKSLLPESLKEEVHIINPPERKNYSFTGGSILACISTFNNWIKKSIYEEEGKSIVHKICPNII